MGVYLLCFLALLGVSLGQGQRWTPEKAREWYAKQKWLVGCNFIPSTAINELEMFQAETFDPLTIDRELGYAELLGFNSIRVFLHYLLWLSDKQGFYTRMDQLLAIAAKHHITVMPVLFDDCWGAHPKVGRQPEPVPHVHNSGWMKSPGVEISQNVEKHFLLQGYVKEVIARYANDPRVIIWDLYNEPGNGNPDKYAVPLLQRVFAWAREVNPSQPLIAAVWTGDWSDPDSLSAPNKEMLTNSDVIIFHNYGDLNSFKRCYNSLLQYNRPIICNEYMARPAGSTFKAIMPFMKEKNVGAYNWGFVSGKTQTIYPWDSWQKKYTEEPKVWFHDIFRQDGSPFDQSEVDLIKSLTH